MEKVEVCRKTAKFGRRRRTLIYSITITEANENIPLRQYGASIRISENAEEETVNDISVNADEIEKFVYILAENNVTPVTLRDVVYDWLGR